MKLLYAFSLFLLTIPFLAQAQRPATGLQLKNGSISRDQSILNKKYSHPLWKSSLFKGNHYVLLQFDQLPDSAEKRSLSARGIRLCQYLPGNVFLAELSETVDSKSIQGYSIDAIYPLSPVLKISKKEWDTDDLSQNSRNGIAAVNFFGTLDLPVIIKELEKTGAVVIYSKIKPKNAVFINASYQQILKIARLPFVASINRQTLKDIPLNNNNRALHGVDGVAASSGRNLQGRNVTVGIGDNADPSSHIDFTGRLILRTAEPVDYHGTHVSGTVAGAGILNPKYKGMAPKAKLVINPFSDIIINAANYFSDFNMVLTNNSYYNGLADCPGEGAYDDLSSYTDDQLITYPKLMHVFASGNDGPFTCSPYLPYFGTVKSGFQCAKNVMTIGAMNNYTYDIHYGSSRGPAADGRIKPEIVCSGVYITSTFPYNGYGLETGTSMAAPTATGILALLYERYRQLHGGTDPPAALIKAIASNSADDRGNPGPDYTFGFGMLNARTAVETMEKNQIFNGNMNNGGNANFTISGLPAGVQQLKVMLYWADPAAAPLAATALVNDLDLSVTTSTGTLHHPMVLDQSPANVNNPATEGIDRNNNIEQVVINNPPAGDCNVHISGSSIPLGPQPYYVVYQVINPSVTVEYPFGNETIVTGEDDIIRWSAYGGDTNPFTIEYSGDNGASWNLLSNNVPGTSRSFLWTAPSIPTSQALVRITRNTEGLSDVSDYPFTVIGQPALTVSNTCPGYAQLLWNSIPGAGRYEITMLNADSMKVVASTTDTSYLFSGLKNDSSYWFSVQPVINSSAGRRALAVNIIPNSGTCSVAGINNDLSLDSITAPVSGRMFTSTQPGNTRIRLAFRNPGAVATSTPLLFSYQVNGGSIVTETYPGPVAAGTSASFIFSAANSYDFSTPGRYSVKAWLQYAGDTIPRNDSLSVIIKNLKNDTISLNPSFNEGFEGATANTYTGYALGLDSLDRTDFISSAATGRLSTFFNSGFPRSGNRCATLDMLNAGTDIADSLISTFNLSNYNTSDQLWLDVYYKKQSLLLNLPGNGIWIRGNDQAAWIPVKNLYNDADPLGIYLPVNVNITGTLAAASPSQSISSSFQIKCGYEGSTPAESDVPGASTGGGISFDDLKITKATNDAALLALLQPVFKNICNLSNAETISIKVRNYSTDTLKNVPVTYSVNGNTITENIPVINPNDSIVYSFNRKADLSAYANYQLQCWVSYALDNYHNNDSTGVILFQTTPLISSYPYLEGFEASDGNWYTNGINDNWQWGKPAKTIINKAANGNNAWVTKLSGNYSDNQYSFLYSPCFDLSSLTHPVISFSHIFQTEDACNCDFHWLEYSVDDSVWTKLGSKGNGTNWYDDSVFKSWQLSNTRWHVSSYDIPVNPPKLRFRFVMYSDPGTNYEGVAIDDIHIFEKAPVYADSSLPTGISQPVSGSGWNDFDINGKRIVSINPNGQDLGNTTVKVFIDTASIRDTTGQYYGARNIVIQPGHIPASAVSLRFYFTDSESNKLIAASGCAQCGNMHDTYESGITQYSSKAIEEDSTLSNNLTGNYIFFKPQQDVHIIPNDNGYYAEYDVKGFSEFWINDGGKNKDQPVAAFLQIFTATAAGNKGLLQWDTWQEKNVGHFIIQKSSDSISYSDIGSVTAVGNTDTISAYQFTDNTLLNGNNYYRLKIIYSNGDSSFSAVRNIAFSKELTDISIYPNPVSDILFINTSTNCNQLVLFDVTGRLVKSVNTSGLRNTLYMKDLAKGIYFIKVKTDSTSKTKKIAVE